MTGEQAMTDDIVERSDALTALLNYEQADMDGTMVRTSRQAIHEVAAEIEALRKMNVSLEGENSHLEAERDRYKAMIAAHEQENPDAL